LKAIILGVSYFYTRVKLHYLNNQ